MHWLSLNSTDVWRGGFEGQVPTQGTSKTIPKVVEKFSWQHRWIMVIYIVWISFFAKHFVLVQNGSCDTGRFSYTTVIGGKWCCGSLFSHSLLEMVSLEKNKLALLQELYKEPWLNSTEVGAVLLHGPQVESRHLYFNEGSKGGMA